jgi:glucose-6-phosphate 1-dehydrogenase
MTHQQLSPAALIIFGITGDLARRKLLPALYHLAADDLLPEGFEVIGVTRSGTTVESLTESIRSFVAKGEGACDEKVLEGLAQRSASSPWTWPSQRNTPS